MSEPNNKESKIKKQIEFYFSDSNLYRDEFLRGKVASDPQGFVDLSVICTFTRMQALLGTQSVEDSHLDSVATALADSPTLVLSDDKRKVRRSEPLTKPVEDVVKEVDSRSIYAAPFPFDATLDSLVDFFETIGDLNCIRMRRHLTSKDFKGSIFVEFSSVEEAQRVQGLPVEFAGAPLQLELKEEYAKRKKEAAKDGQEAAQPTEADALATETAAEPNKKRGRVDDDTARDKEGVANETDTVEAAEFTPGCLVRFDFGAETTFSDNVTFGLVKDSFGGKESGVLYVEYEENEKKGMARFRTPEQAQAALKEANEGGKRLIAGYQAVLKLVEGEEEAAYMKNMAETRAKAEKERHAGGGKRGGGRGGRGGRRGGGGRGGGRGRRGGKRQKQS